MSNLERLDEALKETVSPFLSYMEDWNVVRKAARAYRDLMRANGERVEWCETHGALEAVEEDPGFCWRYDGDKPCRIVSKLLSDYPKEECDGSSTCEASGHIHGCYRSKREPSDYPKETENG